MKRKSNPKAKADTGTLSVRIDGELLDALHELAQSECRSLNNFFNAHVEEELAKLVFQLHEKKLAGQSLAVKPRRLVLREPNSDGS